MFNQFNIIMNTQDTVHEEVKSKKKLRAYKKLGFTTQETADIVEPLNLLLANYHVHYQKLRNYHWNVKGPDFFDIHEQFEMQYNEAKLNIDDVAERIRVFGYTPMSTLKEYLANRKLKKRDPIYQVRRW